MVRKITFVCVASLLLVLIGQGAEGREKKSGMCPMCKMHKEMMSAQEDPGHMVSHLLMHAKEIGLMSDQVAKLKALRLDLERTRLKSEAEIGVAGLELDDLVGDEQTDFSAIEAKVKHKAALEADLELAAIRTKREALALLTPEQREKKKELSEKMMERMMGNMMRGMMGRMQPRSNEGGPPAKDEHGH